jgi:hypothetical protein
MTFMQLASIDLAALSKAQLKAYTKVAREQWGRSIDLRTANVHDLTEYLQMFLAWKTESENAIAETAPEQITTAENSKAEEVLTTQKTIMISEKYPLLVRRLVSFAAHRIANSTQHQESQIKGEITYQNYVTNRILMQLPIMRRVLDLGQDLSMNEISPIANEDPRYVACKLAIRECQMQLMALKRSLPTNPRPEHYAQAEKEVTTYLQVEQKPTHLSKREKWHLSQALMWGQVPQDWSYLGQGYEALSEPVLETFTLAGEPIAHITRNAYGVLCLNALKIMFSDIDFGDDNYDSEVSCHSSPWNRKENPEVSEVMDAIAEVANDYDLRFEVYKTCKGYRLLEMSRTWNPTGVESSAVLERMGCDRLYQKLCIAQDCYRARLEVKPWRIGDVVCHHVETIGSGKNIEEAIVIQKIHDQYCLGDADGDLA